MKSIPFSSELVKVGSVCMTKCGVKVKCNQIGIMTLHCMLMNDYTGMNYKPAGSFSTWNIDGAFEYVSGRFIPDLQLTHILLSDNEEPQPTKSMKKFDLEKAKAGEPICIGTGELVTEYLIGKTKISYKHPIEGEIRDVWMDGGFNLSNSSSEYDLFMATKTVTKYVGWYRLEHGFASIIHDSESELRRILEANGEEILAIIPNTFEI